MTARPLSTKVLSIFVIGFVCLNAFGAVCVAYCQAFVIKEAEASHCPMAANEGHHGNMREEPASPVAAVTDESLDYCPLTITFVAAPIEASQKAPAPPAELPVEQNYSPLWTGRPHDSAFSKNAYRGPPLDRRIDRVKNCILLI